MTRIGRWWGTRSAAERFDVTTRWSMYLLLGLPLLFVASALTSPDAGGRVDAWVPAALVPLGLGHVVACAFLVDAATERYLGRPARLRRRLVPPLLLTVAAAGMGAAGLHPGPNPSGVPSGVVLTVAFAGMLLAALSPVISSSALAGLVVAGAAVAAAGEAAVTGPDGAVPAALVTLVWGSFLSGTYRFSAWMLGVVWEVDRGRTTAARLAVAEERLRFARDLHDVLGRNLSVIAVKSELAGRLAERGDAAAVAEMAEVRRVAHDSLREVRDVVRGYRTADLDTELAGARSVLRSAGVECRVIGDGAHLPEAVQAALGWVVREATTNVIRHSDATTCTIGLDVRTDGSAATAVLRMENDRPRPAPPDAAGTGLAGLTERLAGLGGRLTAERQPGGRNGGRPGDRFVVEASVPVGTP